MTPAAPSTNVFNAEADPYVPSGTDLALLKSAALASPLRRARVRLHRSDDDPIHEMLIVLARGGYIRPHRHPGKTETFHLVEGEAAAVFFDDAGGVSRHLVLSRRNQAPFLYHVRSPLFHTQLVLSEFVVFHEVTNGPFRKDSGSFAPWAPAEAGSEADAFMAALQTRLGLAAPQEGGRP